MSDKVDTTAPLPDQMRSLAQCCQLDSSAVDSLAYAIDDALDDVHHDHSRREAIERAINYVMLLKRVAKDIGTNAERMEVMAGGFGGTR